MRTTKTIRLLLSLFLLANTAAAQTWPVPTQEAKPGSRWWWLGSALTTEDVKWNMQQYARAGIGSLEITPLYGVQGNQANELQFLSKPWMEMLRYVEQQGAANKILIDMNNGTGWPFGGPTTPVSEAAAKLLVTDTLVSGKTLRKGFLLAPIDAKERPYAALQRVVIYQDDRCVWVNQSPDASQSVVLKSADKKATYRVLAAYCSRTRQQVKRAAPGGEGYVIDHFDRNAVAHYLNRFETAFSDNNVPYPHTFFNDSYEVYGANWTPTLYDEFAKRRGYALDANLLFLLGWGKDEQQNTKVLADYRETLGELLLDNFTSQWVAWAHRHHAKVRNQAHGSPANLIDIYSAVDIPEIEGFGLSDFGIKGLRTDPGFTKKNFSDVSMLKYASSAAHITGKPLTSSETFTWLTEHFRTSLSQCKPDLDLMFTCGVNHVFFHGTCYSPKNDAWPGWKFYASIDMSPTNSIWRDAPYMMQYIERCQSFLQMGTPDNDFLVLLPVRDMWSRRQGKGVGSLLMQFDIHSMDRKAPNFIKSILEIDSLGYDCDYISEKYLQGCSFHDGMITTGAGTRYKALIIPGSGKMSDATRSHINAMAQQGATIIYGNNTQAMQRAARPEEMKLQAGLRAIRRKNDKGYHYFIVNLTPNDIHTACAPAVTFTDAMWFNPLNGERYAATINNGKIAISLKSGESMILQTFDHPLSTNTLSVRAQATTKSKPINGIWTLNFIESAPHVAATFTMDKPQTWEQLPDDSVKVTMGTGVYTTHIKCTQAEASKDWMIDLGDVRESARVYINDKLIGCAWAAPFVLHCGKAFKTGNNTLRIEVTNLPANRIASLDRQNVKWRKFNEINVVDINYKKTLYDNWQPVPSGLNSSVTLYETTK